MRRAAAIALSLIALVLYALTALSGRALSASHTSTPGAERPGQVAAVPLRLQRLAARARTRRGWAPLRRYAASSRSSETSGLAWFVLGYREFDSGLYDAAAQDLKRSVSTRSSLASFAAYYEALADSRLNRAGDGIAALADFVQRFPSSVLRTQAADLLAKLFLASSQPARALAALEQETGGRGRASSLLLMAQTYEALGRDAEAAKSYQQVYYTFPASPDEAAAAEGMRRLRLRMGSRYPEPSLEEATSRAARLADAGRYDKALAAYDELLRDHPRQPAGPWQLGRARCFMHTRSYGQALAALVRPDPQDPALDARRLALKAHICELAGREPELLATLDELFARYPQSPSRGDALAYAGGFFARQGMWQPALRYYSALAGTFPHGRYAEEAAWRVAWYHVLAGNLPAARSALLRFLSIYPGSPRVPAALYWLSKVYSRQGEAREGADMARLLAAQYANTYYGLRARQDLHHPPSAPRAAGNQSATESFEALGVHVAARPPAPLRACGPSASQPAFEIYSTLESLSLDRLSNGYLEAVIATHAHTPELFFAVARLRDTNRKFAAAMLDARRAAPDYADYPFDSLPEELWRILYPDPYWRLVRRYAHASHVDPYLVMGLIRQESAFDPHATSITHARGLMQIEPYTAVRRVRGRGRRRRVVRDLYNPAYNIREGCRYLRSVLDEFHGNTAAALAAYNAGDDKVREWIANSKVSDPADFLETIPFTDTRAYVLEVLRDRMIYRSVLTGRARFARCAARSRQPVRGRRRVSCVARLKLFPRFATFPTLRFEARPR